MAKNFKVGIILEGDEKGGVKAVRATRSELEKLAKQSKENGKQAAGLSAAYERAGARTKQALAGIGVVGAAGVAALTVLVKQSFETVDSLGKIADTINTDTKALAGLRLAADLTGLSAGDMDKALEKMVRQVGDARNGSKMAADAISKLGLNLDEFSKLRADEQFALISERIQGVENRADQAAIATALFGRSGVKMLNTLDLGPEKLRAITDELDTLNVALSREEVAAVEAANDSITKLRKVGEGLGNTVAVQIAPFITDISDRFYQAALTSGGFEQTVTNAMNAVARGIGFVGDAGRGLNIVFKGIEIAGIGASSVLAKAFVGIGHAIEFLINAGINDINRLIDAYNLIPGLDDVARLDAVDFSNNGMFGAIEQFANDAPDLMRQTVAEMQDLLMDPLPSAAIAEWMAEVRAKSSEAKPAVEGLFNVAQQGAIGVVASTEQATAAIDEQLAALQAQITLIEQGAEVEVAATIVRMKAAGATDAQIKAHLALNKQLDEYKAKQKEGKTEDEERLETQQALYDGIAKAFDGIGGAGEAAISRITESAKIFSEVSGQAISESWGAYAEGSAVALQGLQQFTEQGSKEYERLGAIISVLQTASGIQAVANTAATAPFPANFVAAAAMAASLASMGIQIGNAFGGGGSSAGSLSQRRQQSQGTGTVFGDADAKSESIQSALDTIADASESLVGINTRMLMALTGVEQSIAGLANNLVRMGIAQGVPFAAPPQPGITDAQYLLGSGSALGTAAFVTVEFNEFLQDTLGDALRSIGLDLPQSLGAALAGGLLGGLDTRVRVQDRGIQIDSQSILDLVNGIARVSAYQQVGINRAGPGGQSQRIDTVDLTGSTTGDAIRLVFEGIGAAVREAADLLQIDAATFETALGGLDFEEFRISLEDLSYEEQVEAINAVFSQFGDRISGAVVVFSALMAEGGEGALETVLRLASNVNVATEALARVGSGFSASAEFIEASASQLAEAGLESAQALQYANARISTALIEAAGGYSEFVGLTQGYIDEFKSEAEQFAILQADASRAFGQLGLQVPATRQAYEDLIDGFVITDEASAALYTQLLALAPLMDEIADRTEALARERGDLEIQLLEAQGRSAEALALSRQRDLDGMDESLHALQRQVWAAQDAAAAQAELEAAEEEAARAAEQLANQLTSTSRSLQRQIAELRGQSVAGLDLGFLLQDIAGAGELGALAALIPDLQTALTAQMEEQIRAIEQSGTQIGDAISDASRGQLDVMREQLSSLQRLADISVGLRQYVTGLAFNPNLALGNPEEQAQAALQQFLELAAAAPTDAEAAGQLQSMADQLLGLAKDAYASSPAYAQIFELVRSTLLGVADDIDNRSPELIALEAQLAQLEQINTNQGTQTAALNAGYQAQIEALRSNLADQLESVATVLNGIEAATLLSGDAAEATASYLANVLADIADNGLIDTVQGFDTVAALLETVSQTVSLGADQQQAALSILQAALVDVIADGTLDTFAGLEGVRAAMEAAGVDITQLGAITQSGLGDVTGSVDTGTAATNTGNQTAQQASAQTLAGLDRIVEQILRSVGAPTSYNLLTSTENSRQQLLAIKHNLQSIVAGTNHMAGTNYPAFRVGGVAVGPSSGYLAELHGTETIFPTVRLPGGDYGVKGIGGFDTRELVVELRALRDEMREELRSGNQERRTQTDHSGLVAHKVMAHLNRIEERLESLESASRVGAA